MNGERSASVKCPECGSKRIYKAGFRHLKSGISVQRFLCRDCGLRFSEPSKKRQVALERSPKFFESKPKFGDVKTSNILTVKPGLKNSSLAIREDVTSHEHSLHNNTSDRYISIDTHSRDYRVGVSSARGAKNLAEVIGKTTRQAGATANIKASLIDFAWQMKKQGYSEATIRTYAYALKNLVKHNADLTNGDSVKEVLAKSKWSNAHKNGMIAAFTLYLSMHGKIWNPPICKLTRKLPFIPIEKELDSLIAGCGKKTSAFLQTLKETALRRAEACNLKWKDLDFQRKIIVFNNPLKNGNPRILKISDKLVSMLSTLPKKNKYLFGTNNKTTRQTVFYKAKKRLAAKLGNPRLLRIGFHTFRHWKATMLYHQTHDIILVKEFLGHKSLNTTLLYIQLNKALFQTDSEEFNVKAVKDLEEIKALLEVGFEYVCQKDDLLFFRRRK